MKKTKLDISNYDCEDVIEDCDATRFVTSGKHEKYISNPSDCKNRFNLSSESHAQPKGVEIFAADDNDCEGGMKEKNLEDKSCGAKWLKQRRRHPQHRDKMLE